MIKVEIANEQEDPVKSVKFEFRRHHLAHTNAALAQRAFLVASSESQDLQAYAIKVDGITQVVEVRRRDFEKLGFRVVVVD